MNSFMVLKVASEIQSFTGDELQLLAEILAGTKNGPALADQIGFAIFDNDKVTDDNNLYLPEIQEA